MTIAPRSSVHLPRRKVRRRAVAPAIALVLAIVLGLWGSGFAHRLYLDEAEARGNNTLRLSVAVLRGHMARYENLPQVIADLPRITSLLSHPSDTAQVDEVNRYLKQINSQLGSSDIYVMDSDGTTLAASNYDSATPFVGENFSYRPYFFDAMNGVEGRFYALGTTSLKRGYFFGAPVTVSDNIAGVVAVKMDVESIEEAWPGAEDYAIIVTDLEGIIFMSSEANWLYKSVPPLSPDRLRRTAETRRYADAELTELPHTEASEGGRLFYTITREGSASEYLVVSEAMPEAGWSVAVLLDTSSARTQAVITIIIGLMAIAMTSLAVAIIFQRRARLRDRLQMERDAHELLEKRVEERTEELAGVNRRLEDEVVERRGAEERLRKTQSDLIQAGKLAALGQMSAALSHEFNQPLAAARNYADNALLLIERGKIADASDALGRISGLIDRMTRISRHLRNFARKPNQKLKAVPLENVVGDTLEILNWRIRSAEIDLSVDLGPEPLVVVAGPIRLQQVLVNILTNAIDVAEQGSDRRIELTAERKGKIVAVRVRDHGPGIAPALSERIFDPFFSTKGVGKGLGLGLSISYNIVKDFGGELRAVSHPQGGAVFTLELASADMGPITQKVLDTAP
jgi:two-component system C4-dicarboxylate transport sensor histidine kinase DctB